MKVKFLKSHPKYGYFPGQEGEIKEPKELIKQGYVVEVEPQPAKEEAPKSEKAKPYHKGKKK